MARKPKTNKRKKCRGKGRKLKDRYVCRGAGAGAGGEERERERVRKIESGASYREQKK
jgi:hypothetical protein